MKTGWGRSWHRGGWSVNPGCELDNWGIRLTVDHSWGYWEWMTQIGPCWLYVGYISRRRMDESDEFLAKLKDTAGCAR